MTSLPRSTRAPRAALLATVLAVAVLTALTTGCEPQQARTNAALLVNRDRMADGLVALGWDDELGNKAQAWADRLAAAAELSHSILQQGVTPGWRLLGENVGFGNDVLDIHQAFMNSPVHRGAILERRYRGIGVGIATGANGKTYVVQVFRA